MATDRIPPKVIAVTDRLPSDAAIEVTRMPHGPSILVDVGGLTREEACAKLAGAINESALNAPAPAPDASRP